MTSTWRQWFGSLSLAISLLSGMVAGAREPALANIVPDGTLGPERSTVHALGPQLDRIEGGALRGTNLFHSFRAFNIGEGRGAYFANPAAVENIFSRVTGGSPSRLFGTLGVLGKANLFFLNPNGILFGPNFSLDVRGSFVASTANSLAFPDGSLFSASEPQAPPLLTVNVTAPIGLRFEGASPGAIVNAGNLTANEGQNLTLAAGTVASTGLLSAPGGEVAVVSVPGAGADGMPTVQLGEAGQFLSWALEPLPVSSAGAAVGVSLPDLLAGEATTGLTVNATGEVELAASGLAVAAGDVTVQQLSARTATLSAAGNLTLVESQLGTTGDLQLLATDTVRVRDSATNPFIAAAGGELLIQGGHSVDIFALNHGSSGLFSGGDMTLRSADTVNGDAHYWSGGSFQIEQLDGTPGNLFSPHDPVIRSQGDVRFNNYQGTSLHILAGGQVDIGTAIITGTDTLADAINPTTTPTLAHVTLSDGTPLVIDGNAQPTLDIRAGMDPAAIGAPLGTSGANFPTDFFLELFGSSLFLVPPPANNPVATRADIMVDDILINTFDGLVFLTNQYQPNLSLPRGDITVTGAGVLSIGGIDARGRGGPSSAIILDARQDIHLSNSFVISGSGSGVGDAGNITLIAHQDLSLTGTSLIDSSTIGPGKGGDINIKATSLSLNHGSQISTNATGAGMGGNLTVDASEFVHLIGTSADGRFISSLSALAEGAGDAGAVTVNARELLVQDGARIVTNTSGDGAGGNLILNVTEWVQLIGTSPDGQGKSGLFTETLGNGNAGNLTIATRQLQVQDGAAISSSTFGDGAGGSLNVNGADWVQVIGTSPDGQSTSGLFALAAGNGNAGNLTIATRQLQVQDGARLSSGTIGNGTGGSMTVNAADWVQVIGTSPNGLFSSSLTTGTVGKGNAGSLSIATRQLRVQDGATISTSTFGDGTGGSMRINVADSIYLIGTFPNDRLGSGLFTQTNGKGDAGSLSIATRQLWVQDGATISTSTFGDGAGGSMRINASESMHLIGTFPNGRIGSGLFTQTNGKGDAGSLSIATRQLWVQDGALVSTSTSGDGAGGSLMISAAESVQLFGTSLNSRLRSALVAETSGKGNAGSLTIATRQLRVQDGALVSTSTSGDGAGGSLRVNATESVELIGTSPDNRLRSTLVTETRGKGDAGELNVSTRKLLIRDGAQASVGTLGGGSGGSLKVDAAESVELIGTSPDSRLRSSLLTQTNGEGAAGRLTIDTRHLLVHDGALISTGTLGGGAGGSLRVNATELVELRGTSPDGSRSSGLVTQTNGKGAAGDLTIGTRHLRVQDGAAISASTIVEGAGGNLRVDAAELVELIGTSPIGRRRSGLFAQTEGKGAAGNLTIGTQLLRVQNGAMVSTSASSDGAGGSLMVSAADSVQLIGTSSDGQLSSALITQTTGKGNAGSLTLNTQHLLVRNGSAVSSSTSSDGVGGSLRVDAADSVQLIGTSPDGRRSSVLVAQAEGKGNAGSITIGTRQLLVRDGAAVSSSTFGEGAGGSLSVTAADWVQLIGTPPDGRTGSGLFTETHGKGDAGSLTIDTRQLLIRDGAAASSSTFGDGAGASLRANAVDLIELIGTISNARSSSGLFTQTTRKGNAGSLTIGTRQLLVRDGAAVSSSTFGDGAGGSLNVTAADWVRLIGNSPDGRRSSGLFTQTNGKGDAGNLTIDTRQLRVQNGAMVSAGTFGDGSGGSLSVTAADWVQLSGISSDRRRSSGLFTATNGKGDAGNLKVTTGALTIRHGAEVSAGGIASGNAGNLDITARSILMENWTRILTETASGEGGNITLNVSDLLLLRRNSQISATAGTAQAGGDGGNININAGFVVAVPGENSDIFANAFTGRGGNINITANGIFGLKFRPFLTEFSDITASSQFGVDGTVQLNTLGIDPSRGLGLLPNEPTTLQVAASCQTRGGRAAVEFFDVGSGGLPPRPDEPLHSATIIADLLPLELEAGNALVSGADDRAVHGAVAAAAPLSGWDLLSCQKGSFEF